MTKYAILHGNYNIYHAEYDSYEEAKEHYDELVKGDGTDSDLQLCKILESHEAPEQEHIPYKNHYGVDYYTKCAVKPIVKEHMCDECYTEHCQWLRELSAPKMDNCCGTIETNNKTALLKE